MKQQDSLETMVANFIDNSASNFLYNDVYYYRSICELYGKDAVDTEIICQYDLYKTIDGQDMRKIKW